MEKIKIKTLTSDALVDIKISGTFYSSLVQVLTRLGESMPLEDFKKILTKLGTEETITDLTELNIQVLMSLIYEIETQAVKQNKTTEKEIEVSEESKSS